MSDPTNWRSVLPIHRGEMWFIRIFMIIMIWSSGFGAGYIWHEFNQGFQYVMDYTIQKVIPARVKEGVK